ncbi:MAG TPA: bifunctional diaminohydroxyphosphoribosylaminopyrimidine deaminase/5-amino-6-(5-phosphoribosylamino)uracil reductase RibD [Xanthobacteraceae bacterium]|nr:bifunctional diaminohydroxyphosphoribosylaminopyrimidine deaminase/5-amino-6-(5-phosphoribosylamino)uracil reductase RibD [Xanthobacteraceae bacterium]
MDNDVQFMAQALALGRRGLGRTWPNPSVGAVIVRNDGDAPIIVGRAATEPGGRPHAETQALARAGAAAAGATLYVSLEPCSHHGKTPPCADAIVIAGVARVVSALEDPNPEVAGRGHARLRAAGVEVVIGVGAAEARRAHAGHIRRVRDHRPHVTLKLAVSADGKAGLAGRRPAVISGKAARAQVHLMRAMNDAILVGIGTVLADDPLLTCRLPGMALRSPVRVVLDRSLRLPAASRLARSAREVPLWIITAETAPMVREQALRTLGIDVLRVAERAGRLDLAGALGALAERGVTRLMVEGGPTVAASLLTADLVDAAMLIRSSAEIGADGVNALEGLPQTALTDSPRLRLIDSQQAGMDRIDQFERS